MRDNTFSKKVFIKTVSDNLKNKYRKTIDDATQQELYQAVSEAVKDVIMDEWIATQRVMDKDDPKVVYYMSMEFLMGRALGNNLINLSAYKEVKEALNEIGVDINAIEDQEPDPALGNGGLGRLAACFMDSLATLGYPAYGCGIRYRYGMFKQQISDGFQIEVPDNWLKDGYPFELRRPEYCYEVKFGGYVQESTDENGELHFEQKDYQSVLAVPYDMPIVGYDNNVVNSLMIWDAEPKNGFSLESFDQGDYDKAVEQENLARNLVEVLYPNDNHVKGKELRLKQQYFFVSATIQRAVERYMEKFPAYCIKGELLGANDAALNAAECYGNGQHGFLPAVFAPSPLPEAPKAAKQAEEDDYSKAYTALQASHKKQIEEFSVLLEQRSDEIAAVNARWKTQLEKMEQELSALRMENAQLRQSSLPEQAEKES